MDTSSRMNRPPDHPRRFELNDEVHARPPEALQAPARVSYLALLLDGTGRAEEVARLADLARSCKASVPAADANHFAADLGPFRIKWERHTEFSRYMFIVDGASDAPFGDPAIERVPAGFVAGLPGEVIAAAHVALLPAEPEEPVLDALSRTMLGGNVVVGSRIGDGAATALTDFRIHADGFSRFVVCDRELAPRQAGRVIQRLLEIDTYKTLALLAFPVARELGPFLGRSERELAAITTSLADAGDANEGALLDRLTRLEAEIESRGAENQFRFGAAAAYYELVRRRIGELREARLSGVQTFGEFVERRLAPAMNTCEAVVTRQEALSGRVARATTLLSTRVDVTQARQNQDLLQSMNRRAQLQLRLQETVEGLSIAAVTYYIVGLVGYAAKGAKPLGADFNPDVAMAASIPIVLLLVAIGIRRIRRAVGNAAADP